MDSRLPKKADSKSGLKLNLCLLAFIIEVGVVNKLWSFRVLFHSLRFVKLLVLKPFLYLKTNGAEISLGEHLEAFQELGHQIRLFCLLPEEHQAAARQLLDSKALDCSEWPEAYRIGSLRVELQFVRGLGSPHEPAAQPRYEEEFFKAIEESSPDWIWVHYTDFFALSSAQNWSPNKTWVRQSDNEYPRLKQMAAFRGLFSAYQGIKNFLVASEFMSRQVGKDFPQAEVFHLPNPMSSMSVTDPVERSEIVFVNPIAVKGVDFVLDLVQDLPEQSFLFVGNWGPNGFDSPAPNIRFVESFRSSEEIFRRASLLLMPSRWEEAFGRVAMEAMAAGVPVIASDRGNLPHTLGHGGQSLPLEKSLWLKAIHDVLENPLPWVKKGRRRVKEYLSFAQQQRDLYLQHIQRK